MLLWSWCVLVLNYEYLLHFRGFSRLCWGVWVRKWVVSCMLLAWRRYASSVVRKPDWMPWRQRKHSRFCWVMLGWTCHAWLKRMTPSPYRTCSVSADYCLLNAHTHTYTHTSLTALFPGLPGWAGARKVKPIWILLKQESEWQWHQLGLMQVCTLLQTDNHASTPLLGYRPDALPAAQPTASKKHWRHMCTCVLNKNRHTHTHPFNGPFSRTTQVSWYQKGKTNQDFSEA